MPYFRRHLLTTTPSFFSSLPLHTSLHNPHRSPSLFHSRTRALLFEKSELSCQDVVVSLAVYPRENVGCLRVLASPALLTASGVAGERMNGEEETVVIAGPPRETFFLAYNACTDRSRKCKYTKTKRFPSCLSPCPLSDAFF